MAKRGLQGLKISRKAEFYYKFTMITDFTWNISIVGKVRLFHLRNSLTVFTHLNDN